MQTSVKKIDHVDILGFRGAQKRNKPLNRIKLNKALND